VSSGQGMIIDLGKRNTMGRFAAVKYFWSEAKKERYDLYGELPFRAWDLDKNTPVVRLSFMRLQHFDDLHPVGTKGSDWMSACLLKTRDPSLIVCDLYPHRCIRMAHGRFIFPSERLVGTTKEFAAVKFREGLMDQYSVDEDDIMTVITSLFSAEKQVILGHRKTPVNVSTYCCLLGELQGHGVHVASFARDIDADEEGSGDDSLSDSSLDDSFGSDSGSDSDSDSLDLD
jgi:hypothetical protein